MPTSRTVFLVALIATPLSGACSIDVQSSGTSLREEKRFTLTGSGPVELRLRTFDGSISVRSWDRNEVLVEIERRGPDQASAQELAVDATQEGNRIVVEARQPTHGRRVHFGWVSPAVHLAVTAPRHAGLEARTGDGAIQVDEVSGTVTLESGDGSIRVSRVDGALKAHTGDGSINIDEAKGQIDADSGDGSIAIAGRLDELTVRTGDGSVNVELFDGSQMKGDWRVTSGDGNIRLRLPPRFDADVDAHTGDGSVRVEGLDTPDTRDGSDRHSLQGRLGAGGAVLHLRSGDGSIVVTR